jgi:excisionase family DNA binding protein
MEVIVIESQAFYTLIEEVKKEILKTTPKTIQEPKDWLSAKEAKELLGVKSKSKMQQLRDQGEIVFCKHGRIIRYHRESIVEFLERNTVR